MGVEYVIESTGLFVEAEKVNPKEDLQDGPPKKTSDKWSGLIEPL